MPHLFQGTKRYQRFTTVLAIAAFLTFSAHMVGQERVHPSGERPRHWPRGRSCEPAARGRSGSLRHVCVRVQTTAPERATLMG
jgi:hypothetical protein